MEDASVRVLLFHPWGRFESAYCGSAHTACAQLEYFHDRGWDVHCIMQEIPAWGITAGDANEITSRFACVKSVRTVRVDCPPVAARNYGEEFCRLLYAAERAAHIGEFRAIAAEPWDAFFTTDITAAPYAEALPRTTPKILAASDNYARRAAVASVAPPAMRTAEERFTFGRIEAELYRLFDHVLFPCEADSLSAQRHGAKSAIHVPPWVKPIEPSTEIGHHDLLICGGNRSGDLADLEHFYRHIYLPHLRVHGIRLAVAGPVVARWPVADVRVEKLHTAEGAVRTARVLVAPLTEAAGFCVPVLNAMAARRAVVATPLALRGLDITDDAVAVIDMRGDPVGTAAVIRDLLAAPGWRRALGERAATITTRHTRLRHFTALDEAWGHSAQSHTTRARAA
jgi:hypothetical protein